MGKIWERLGFKSLGKEAAKVFPLGVPPHLVDESSNLNLWENERLNTRQDFITAYLQSAALSPGHLCSTFIAKHVKTIVLLK